MSNTASAKPRRSLLLSGLVFCLFYFSFLNWLRMIDTILEWDFLMELGLAPLPLYYVISGAVWGLAGLVAAVGLWMRQHWCLPLTAILVVIYSIWYWLERLFLTGSVFSMTNWPFTLGLTLLLLFAFLGSLYVIYRTKEFQGLQKEPV
jgi:hypothetical protein